jgi:alpha-galactosidase
MARMNYRTALFICLSSIFPMRLFAVEVLPEEMAVAGRFAQARVDALSSAGMPPAGGIISSVQGWNVLHLGWSVNHRVLQLKGKQYPTGFGSHADADIEYALPAGAKHLSGLCGIDDTEEAKQFPHSVVFSISVDGKQVWQEKPQTSLDDPERFDIDLTGGKVVALVAKGTGDLTYTPADFVDLHLTLADGTVQELGQRRDFTSTQGSGVSFNYDGKPSAEFLNSWPLEVTDLPATPTYTAQQFSRTDPVTHLKYSVALKRYKHYPVVEWTADFENGGSKDSPILEKIKSLDLSISAADKLLLHHNTGDYAAADSYEPHETELVAGQPLHFAPDGGRPTDRAWPYFNLENPAEHGGVIAVVGWPGQWSADFNIAFNHPGELHLTAGQELTHFLLHPGEKARTPLSVMMFYQGDAESAQNLWRRWMLEENVPRIHGKLPLPVNASSLGLHQSEKTEIDGINLFTSHGAELSHWWMDAGWYPCKDWWDGVGSWVPDPVRFPHGIKAVSDAAHSHGLKLILWMEPERVHPGTLLDQQHPEFLLGKDGADKLFNLGNPTAWAWMLNCIDGLIKSQGIDVYRQDFNEQALGFWRADDAADRQGITEMRHIEGYLKLWDELHTRHPDLLIDTCASGGRRLDLETLRRSVPLWRSDDSENPEHNQCQTYGLSSWVPLYGTGTGCNTSYTIRSSMLPFFTLGMSPDGKTVDWNLYHQEKANWSRIVDDLQGDYYPLLPYSRDLQSWIAWQFNRKDRGTGLVQAFRRPMSPFETARFRLHDLEPTAIYVVTDVDHPHNAREISGQELMDRGIEVNLDTAPTAAIVTYQKK